MVFTFCAGSIISDAYEEGFGFIGEVFFVILGFIILAALIWVVSLIIQNLDSIIGCGIIVFIALLLGAALIGGLSQCSCESSSDQVISSTVEENTLALTEVDSSKSTEKVTSTNSSKKETSKPKLNLSDDFGVDPKDYYGIYTLYRNDQVKQVKIDSEGAYIVTFDSGCIQKETFNIQYANEYYAMSKFDISYRVLIFYNDDISENEIFTLRKDENEIYFLNEINTNLRYDFSDVYFECLGNYVYNDNNSLTFNDDFTVIFNDNGSPKDCMYFYAPKSWISNKYNGVFEDSIIVCSENLSRVYIFEIMDHSKLILNDKYLFIKETEK